MNDCWAGNPLDRPSFSDLETRLGEMIGEAERQVSVLSMTCMLFALGYGSSSTYLLPFSCWLPFRSKQLLSIV